MDTENNSISKAGTLADKISQWVLLSMIFLIPALFIPSILPPFQFTKALIAYIGVVAAAIAWAVARLRLGKLELPWHPVFAALAAVPAAFGLSTLFSPAKIVSLVGQGHEVGTLAFIALAAFLTFVTALYFKTKRSVAYAYAAFGASFIIVLAFQAARLWLGPEFLKLDVLANATMTAVGSWSDLGIYFGLAALLIFLTLEFLDLNLWKRLVLGSLLLVAIVFLSVISYPVVWYLLGAFALASFVYKFSPPKIPFLSLALVIVCFGFIVAGGNIYHKLSGAPYNLKFLSRFDISNVEVRPSWGSTLAVAKRGLIEHPIFGTGPNRFLSQWLTSRPVSINNTPFWNADFEYGIGLIPTYFITTGIVGSLALLAFLAFYLSLGFKALASRTSDRAEHFLVLSAFGLSLYLLAVAVLYVPSVALVVLMFFFMGIFLALASSRGLIAMKTIEFAKGAQQSSIPVVAMIATILIAFLAGYGVARRYASAIFLNKGVLAANVNSAQDGADAAEASVKAAIELSPNDSYYRTLADLYLARMNQVVAKANAAPAPDASIREEFQKYYSSAEGAAKSATNYDGTNYRNWLELGKIYEMVMPLNAPDAYKNALSAYTKAKDLSPQTPAIPLVLARLALSHSGNGAVKDDVAKAKQYVAAAEKLKDDYSEAIFLRSQIQALQGDNKGALKSVQAALALSPNDPGIYFQLGLINYNLKNYADAATALEKAVGMTQNYANAKYYLGLAYARLKRRQEAIGLIEDVQRTNPANKELGIILANIRAGRDPAANLPKGI